MSRLRKRGAAIGRARMNGRPLAIIIGGAAHDRLHAALSLAAASAALGRHVSIFLHAEAACAADPGFRLPEDRRFEEGGAPTVAALIDTALALGTGITVCQTGLALVGLSAGAIDPRVEAGGLVDFLGRAGDAEIVLG